MVLDDLRFGNGDDEAAALIGERLHLRHDFIFAPISITSVIYKRQPMR